ncbi:MAG TPA: outer membrane beta-barrel protein [Hanamia sp.]
MEQNNFEKNMQQKLEELKISPSEAVWENVEKNINKRKDRKKILIFFLLFVCLLAGGYFIFNSIQDSGSLQNKLVSTSFEKDSEQIKNKDSSFNRTKISSVNDSEKNNAADVNLTVNKTLSQKIENNKVERKNSNAPSTIRNRNLAGGSKNVNAKEIEPVANNKNLSPTKQTVPASKQTNNQKNDLDINSPGNVQEKNTPFDANGVQNVPDKNMEPLPEVAIQNKKIPVATPADTNKDFAKKTNESTKETHKIQQSHKWKLGVTFSGGTSMVGGVEQEANNASSLMRMDFVSLASPANNYALSSFSSYFRSSPIRNSMAFIGGVYLEKNISMKNKIDIGISYKYYSLRNTTGNKIDFNIDPSLSGNDIYSSWSNINSYRNNFHYIEIPVSMKFQLGNSKSLPFYWSVGANISQLISSNSLQFKSSPGLYYNDNSFYNKTQVGLQTGFSVLLFAKTKLPINIGPYFIYNMSKLANEGLYGGKHFSFFGIKTEILLGKK